jgi:transposase
MSRDAVLSDDQWARIAPLMPCSDGKQSRPFRDHRQVIEGIIYRFRTGIAWRDLPDRAVADGLETAQALQHRRDLGPDPRPADR